MLYKPNATCQHSLTCGISVRIQPNRFQTQSQSKPKENKLGEQINIDQVYVPNLKQQLTPAEIHKVENNEKMDASEELDGETEVFDDVPDEVTAFKSDTVLIR